MIRSMIAEEVSMPDDPTEVIQAAIRSAFDMYPREDDPDWRSPSWIKPDECAHLTTVVLRELEANGFQIVKRTTP
jgi:hypothetical protein